LTSSAIITNFPELAQGEHKEHWKVEASKVAKQLFLFALFNPISLVQTSASLSTLCCVYFQSFELNEVLFH